MWAWRRKPDFHVLFVLFHVHNRGGEIRRGCFLCLTHDIRRSQSVSSSVKYLTRTFLNSLVE